MKIPITISFLLFLSLTVCSCAPTGYVDATAVDSFEEGYSNTKLDENVFKVFFSGNKFTSMERASDFALLRGAEITLEHGYTYFAVVGQDSFLKYGGDPGSKYNSSPRHSILIRCFSRKPEHGVTTYNAEFVKKELSKKYGLHLTKEKGANPRENPAIEGPDFQAKKDAENRGDHQTALKEFRSLAEEGHAEAQTSLGQMYYVGKGVPQDYAEALKWYRLAAEQGDANAQFALGVMYARGQGVPQDEAEAIKWWGLAAKQGHGCAHLTLAATGGEGTEFFKGVLQDYPEAVKWCRLAAEQGDANAQYFLGVLYLLGQDDAEALKWFRLAAEQGDADAQAVLGGMYAEGQGVPQDDIQAYMWMTLAAAEESEDAVAARERLERKMTPDQIAEAQRLAREWRPK